MSDSCAQVSRSVARLRQRSAKLDRVDAAQRFPQ